mgnify:CR=1 FL=1
MVANLGGLDALPAGRLAADGEEFPGVPAWWPVGECRREGVLERIDG